MSSSLVDPGISEPVPIFTKVRRRRIDVEVMTDLKRKLRIRKWYSQSHS